MKLKGTLKLGQTSAFSGVAMAIPEWLEAIDITEKETAPENV